MVLNKVKNLISLFSEIQTKQLKISAPVHINFFDDAMCSDNEGFEVELFQEKDLGTFQLNASMTYFNWRIFMTTTQFTTMSTQKQSGIETNTSQHNTFNISVMSAYSNYIVILLNLVIYQHHLENYPSAIEGMW